MTAQVISFPVDPSQVIDVPVKVPEEVASKESLQDELAAIFGVALDSGLMSIDLMPVDLGDGSVPAGAITRHVAEDAPMPDTSGTVSFTRTMVFKPERINIDTVVNVITEEQARAIDAFLVKHEETLKGMQRGL